MKTLVGLQRTARLLTGLLSLMSALLSLVAPASASPAEWEQTAQLLSDDPSAGDEFGGAIALSQDTALVAATETDFTYVFRFNGGEWEREAKLRGERAPDGAYDVAISGNTALITTYVFRFNGSEWVEEQKLEPVDTTDGFGFSVALSGDTALIGARFDEDNGADSGAAYVFRFNGSEWVQEAKLLAADGAAGDLFGFHLAVSEDTALVGASFDDDNGDRSGSAYVFRFNGIEWAQEAKLLAADGAAFDRFGESVALSGDTALIGAFDDDDNGNRSGSAYVFHFNGTEWVQEAKLLPADGAADDWFGFSVALSGDTALTGAWGDDNENGFRAGSVYVFRFNGSDWVQEAKLLPADGAAFDQFGYSVALSGDTALVANISDDDGTGSAYVFSRLGKIVGAIDIKPGSDPNSINPRSKGKIPVAILTDDAFDALQVDPTSVRFGPNEASIAHAQGHVQDVDGDGNMDLLLHFRTRKTGIACGDAEATLMGETYDGQHISGTDLIKTVGCDPN